MMDEFLAVATIEHQSAEQSEIERKAEELAHRLALLEQEGLCDEKLEVKLTDEETFLELTRRDGNYVEECGLSIKDDGVRFAEKVFYGKLEGIDSEVKKTVISALKGNPTAGEFSTLDQEGYHSPARAEALLAAFFERVNKEIDQRLGAEQQLDA